MVGLAQSSHPVSEPQAPLKPETDTQEYRRIRLDNGLQVLLVHDGETEKAAASIDVSPKCSASLLTTKHGLEQSFCSCDACCTCLLCVTALLWEQHHAAAVRLTAGSECGLSTVVDFLL